MRSKVLRSVRKTKLAAVSVTLLGALGSFTACSDHGAKPHLDVASATASTTSQEEDSWLREQRTLRVKYWDDATPDKISEKEITGTELLNYIGSGSCSTPTPWTGDCNDTVDRVDYYNCMGRMYMAVATIQSDPLQLKTFNGVVVIDRVTEANAADAAVFAGEFARSALTIAFSELSAPAYCKNTTAPLTWKTWGGSGKSAALELAARVGEGYWLAMGAMDRAVEATLNVSDQARSSSLSASTSRQRAILGQKYSRAAAAHMLVGGDDGLLGSTENGGYCLGGALAPKTRAALQLIRDAAPSPSMVAGDINTLVNGTTTGAMNGSIRERLGAFYGIQDLKSGKRAEIHYDLTMEDFTKARDYLVQEMSVFTRSPSAVASTQQPDATGYYRYAGTGGDRVQPLPTGAWAARARHYTTHSRWYTDGGLWYLAQFNGLFPELYLADPYYRPSPAENLIAGSHMRIRDLLKSTDGFSTTVATGVTAESAEVKGVLGSILTTGDYKGTMELYASATLVRPIAYGYTAADKVRVVVGEDGLRCAVEGQIEGAPCGDSLTGANYNYPATAMPAACQTKPATLGCLTLTVNSRQVTSGYYGVDTAAAAPNTTPYTSNGSRNVDTTDLIAKKTRLYFVKLKNPTDPEAPGKYELIGGTPLLLNNWSIFPVVPSLNDRVEEVLAPNRKNCAVPTTNCMGKDFDARLPLEDELSSDGDNVENSWKHYLSLAKQAAAEADALGKEFQQSKLNQLQGEALAAQRQEEKRQAAEAALETVQQMCGTAIDPKQLLAYFSGGASSNNNLDAIVTPPTSSCTASLPCGGFPDTVCIANMCVKDPAKLTAPTSFLANDPDAKKLADCLAGTGLGSGANTAIEPFVTLGNRPLCIYTASGVAPGLAQPCPTQDPSLPTSPSAMPAGTVCPDVPVSAKDAQGVETLTCPNTPAGFTASIAKPLGYFENPLPFSGSATCADFRRARKARLPDQTNAQGQPTALNKIMGSEQFLTGRFSDRVGRLGIVFKYGSHFDVTEDGAARWSSGNIAEGRLNGWPHVLPSDCTSDQAGLFCTTWPTTPTNAQILDLNSRVYNAVMGASAIRKWMDPSKGGVDIIFASTENHGLVANTATSSTLYIGGTTPIRENRNAVGNKAGTKINYTWLNGTEVSAWVGGDFGLGNPVNYLSPQISWYGPKNPRGGEFSPSIASSWMNAWAYGNPTYATFEILGGRWAENEGYGYTISDPEFQTLKWMFGPGWLDHSTRAIVDGYELLCELDRGHLSGNNQPASFVSNPTDLEQTGTYVKNLADQMETAAANLVLPNVPTGAVAALSSAPQDGALPQLGGDMGQAVSDLRNAFVQVRQMTPIITSQLKQMSTAVETLRAQLDSIEAAKEINELDKYSAALNNANACAQSINAFKAITSFGLAQAAACSNAIAQTAIAFKKASLQERIQNNEATIARNAFSDKMAQHAEVMQVASLGLETALENTKAAVNRIENLRKKASLALAKALYLSSYQSGEQVKYDKAVGALTDISQRRYTTALKNAKLMAFFARRAIEQRLGVNLVDMVEDLPLVDAPATWEGDACSMNGIQPEGEIVNTPNTPFRDWITIYGQSFIGEYISKLENVVESYRLDHSFHEGRDVAVISLRDDVIGTRTACSVPSRNLFANSAELDNATSWAARGCTSQTISGTVYPALNCVQAIPSPTFVPTTVPPTTIKVPDLAVKGLRGNGIGAQGYILRFGDGLNTCTSASSCGWASGAALSQVVELPPGRFRLSWYTRDSTGAAYTNAAKSGIVIARKFGTTTTNPTTANFVAPAADGDANERWKRASIEITIPALGTYEIGFGVTQGTMPTAAQEVTVGAVMLDHLIAAPTVTTMMPAFQATDADKKFTSEACEDKGGVKFRSEHWDRRCVHLCSDGFSGNCKTGPQYCYREFSFGVAQPWIATGKLFKYSGFARGNYNYRIDSLALNFVGSATRDCTDAELPSTCYNAGFVPYTLLHSGPFYTRNYAGDDVEALLFDGSIEHARGLALERYVTNPISSTDRDLLQDYLRSEFAGRPLDGNFTVRLWEEPGVNLDGIEDVQLILNYRYWTANE